MTTVGSPRELPEVAASDLRALTPDQQRAGTLARRDPAAAEERLRFLLRRWQSRLNRRYVDEVLLGGAEHARWVAEHHALTSRTDVVVGYLGRAFSDEEAATVASVVDLAPPHRTLVAHLRRKEGPIVASLYLQCVVRDWRSEALRDHVEAWSRALRHDDWVAHHLPRFGSRAGVAP
jgi:hypothetical protein